MDEFWICCDTWRSVPWKMHERIHPVRPEVGICYIFAYYVILEVNISLCLC